MHSNPVRIGAFLSALMLVGSAIATGQSQLVPLVTDKTPLALSDRFGYPYDDAINQAGDFVFVGNMGTAIFLLPHDNSPRVRLMQMGDQVLDFGGSKADVIQTPRVNASGWVAFKVDFALATGELQGAILLWNGTTLSKVVSGLDLIPNSTTVKYQRMLSLVGLSDAGDVAFTAPLVEGQNPAPTQTTLFIAKSGGSIVRVAGIGDGAPGGSQFQSLSPVSLNNRDEVLFNADLANSNAGLFVGDASGAVRKIVVSGDLYPIPLTGTFLSPFSGLLNNHGDVAFNAESATVTTIWLAPVGGGTPSRVVVQGTPAPASVGGPTATFGGPILRALNDAGTVAFTCRINNGTATSGLFRVQAGSVEAVAYEGQPAGWTPTGFQTPSPYFTFADGFGAISINQAGDIAFRAIAWDRDTVGQRYGGNRRYAIYRQSAGGVLTLVAHDGQATPSGVGGVYGLGFASDTVFLDDGRVWFFADVAGAEADFGYFLVASDASRQTIMTTADPLPVDSRVVLRTFRAGASGDYVGFIAQRAGGGLSVGVQEISTLTTKLLMSDREEVESGTRIRVNSRNGVFLNNKGSVAIVARVMDASEARSYNAIGLLRWNGEILGIAGASNEAPGTGPGTPDDPLRRFTNVALNSAGPSPLNDNDQVVFVGTYSEYWNTTNLTGIWVGSPGAHPVKVALSGESVSCGGAQGTFGPYGNFTPVINGISLNNAGQVAFLANPNIQGQSRAGIYLWSSGTPVQIARTDCDHLSGFGYPSLNNNGDLAAIVAGAGVYLVPHSGPPALVAQHGAQAPGTTGILTPGNFSFATARPEVVLNDRGDVAFRASLTGGSSDSGYFVRRPNGTVKAISLQGQTAPGLSVPFAYVAPGTNNVIGENVQLGPDGDVSLQQPVMQDGVRKTGLWHYAPNDTLELVMMRGTLAPQFGGGTAISNMPGMPWNSGSRFPLWARVSGGTFTDGIFLSVPYVPTPTPPGTDIPVQPVDQTTGTKPVDLTFDAITAAGQTTVTTSAAGPVTPAAFTLAETPVFYDITTTAKSTGPIDVCIDISSMTFPGGGAPRLLHFENGSWLDVTTSVSSTRICGSVTSLSPFTVATVPEMAFDVSVTPSVLWPANNKMVGITATIAATQAWAPTPPRVELVSIASNEPLQAGDIVGATVGGDCRSFQLRAKRLGTGRGRTYTITYRATDFVGAAVLRTATVFVPHDQEGK
jgi:hypothetical protein